MKTEESVTTLTEHVLVSKENTKEDSVKYVSRKNTGKNNIV